MICFSITTVTAWVLKHYIITPIIAFALFRYIVVVFNKESGEVTKSGVVETHQDRKEMRARNKSAMEKTTGESFTSRNTRNGWSNESNSWFVSGQKVKDKKK